LKFQHRILHQLVAVVCTVLFSYVTLHAQTGKVFLNPDTTRVSPTDTFQVKIEVDNNVKVIHCYKVSVQFDTTLVRLTDVVEGPLMQQHGTTFFFWNYKQGSYDVLSCILGYGLYADGPGVLATMRFRGMGRAGTTPLIFTTVEFQDTALHYMSVNHRDGAIILSGDQAPSVQVTSPPSGGTYNSLPTLSIHFTDDRGLNRGYYQIDGCTGTWTQLWSYNSASLDTSINWIVPSVSQGLHSIYFKVTDDAGNVNVDSCTYSWSFTYNTSLPTIPLLLSPADSALTCDLSPTFTWTSSTLPLKGSSGSTYEAKNSSSKITSITYTLEHSLNPTFTVATTVENIPETTYTVPETGALTDSAYYWRVESVVMGTHSGYQAHPFRFKAFIAGDANRDHKITVADVVYLVNYLFKGGPAPSPSEAGNVNGDNKVTVSDVVYLVNYLFKGGPRAQCRA